jgi:phospholipase/lecithinase/hemolysin
MRPLISGDPQEQRTTMNQHSFPHLTAALVALTAALAIPADAASSITGIFAFGDSLTDSGNVYAATAGAEPAAPPNFEGRFSNGPTWVEMLAIDHLGLPPMSHSLAGGNNHAWGGSWTGGGGSVPTLVQQVGGFTSGGGSFGPGDLVTVWAGANDFFFGPPDPTIPVGNIGTALDLIAAAGGRKVLVLNLPDLGQTPAAQAQGAAAMAGLSSLSQAFNSMLAGTVSDRRNTLGIEIFELDVFAIDQDLKANPGNYGLTNTTDSALLSGNAAAASSYAYWDSVHPTDSVHSVFALEAANAVVPEPSATLLLGSSAFLIARRRRRSAA